MNQENLFEPNCIRTYSGIYFNLLETTLDMICIEDIAHSLANQCRFAGHTKKFYSVAQHCWHMAAFADVEHEIAALLHDASEAYILDIPSPLKQFMPEYREMEERLMRLIATKFDFEYPLHESVKELDRQWLQREWDGIMLSSNFPVLAPNYAEDAFLSAFNQIQFRKKERCCNGLGFHNIADH